jgi:hypothetical protein
MGGPRLCALPSCAVLVADGGGVLCKLKCCRFCSEVCRSSAEAGRGCCLDCGCSSSGTGSLYCAPCQVVHDAKMAELKEAECVKRLVATGCTHPPGDRCWHCSMLVCVECRNEHYELFHPKQVSESWCCGLWCARRIIRGAEIYASCGCKACRNVFCSKQCLLSAGAPAYRTCGCDKNCTSCLAVEALYREPHSRLRPVHP